MLNNVYMPTFVSVGAGRQRVQSRACVAATTHRQFVRELDLDGRARLVAQGIGQRGRCVDYIRNTLEHMRELGVHDPHLSRIFHAALNLSTDKKQN
jgi:cation transport protein ChaC